MEYHVFRHFLTEALDALSRLGLDARKLENEGLLSIVDSYTRTFEYESAQLSKEEYEIQQSSPVSTPPWT